MRVGEEKIKLKVDIFQKTTLRLAQTQHIMQKASHMCRKRGAVLIVPPSHQLAAFIKQRAAAAGVASLTLSCQ